MRLMELINLMDDVDTDVYLDICDPGTCLYLYEGLLDELPYKFTRLQVTKIQTIQNRFNIQVNCKGLDLNEYIYC